MALHSLPEADAGWAWFLDVDGTLIEIAQRPDAVCVDESARAAIEALHRAADGAVALISGRAIADLDRLFAPLRLPCAGLHGLERRDAGGALHRSVHPSPLLDRVLGELFHFVDAHPGSEVENKGLGVALHYRRAREAEAAAWALADDIAGRYGQTLVVQGGKMVIEFRSPGADKGTAIARFMNEPPFAGRTPVFAGDDVTDEAGFAEVNLRGGLSVRIGDAGHSAANWRLADVAALIDWLGVSPEPAQRDAGGGRR